MTVEELRDRVCDNMDIGWVQSAKLVDSLIAAAREEGAEQVRASLAFVQDDDGANLYQQSANPVVDQIGRIDSMLSTVDEDTRLVVRQMLYDLAAIARVDGRNQEKMCIRRVLDPLVPILAPKEEPK